MKEAGTARGPGGIDCLVLKTWKGGKPGEVKILDSSGKVLLETKAHGGASDAFRDVLTTRQVGKGDLWRACQTKDIAIKARRLPLGFPDRGMGLASRTG